MDWSTGSGESLLVLKTGPQKRQAAGGVARNQGSEKPGGVARLSQCPPRQTRFETVLTFSVPKTPREVQFWQPLSGLWTRSTPEWWRGQNLLKAWISTHLLLTTPRIHGEFLQKLTFCTISFRWTNPFLHSGVPAAYPRPVFCLGHVAGIRLRVISLRELEPHVAPRSDMKRE